MNNLYREALRALVIALQDWTAAHAFKSAADFERSVRALVRGLWAGELTEFEFVDAMNSAIGRAYNRAWVEGARLVGLGPQDLSGADRVALSNAVADELQWLPRFARAISEGSRANGGALTPLLRRAEMWTNGYDRIKHMAMVRAPAATDQRGPKLKWLHDPDKESCGDCLNYSGRVYYAATWGKYGIHPQHPALECTGRFCGCRFVKTDEPVTPGRPPLL